MNLSGFFAFLGSPYCNWQSQTWEDKVNYVYHTEKIYEVDNLGIVNDIGHCGNADVCQKYWCLSKNMCRKNGRNEFQQKHSI